jgi:two-component system, NtrC family, response regulator
MNPVLLIIEDDEEIRTQMKWALAKHYDLLLAGDRSGALSSFQTRRPSVVTLDLGLPPQPANASEGMAALAELLTLDPDLKIIVITGQSEKSIALQAIGQGAYDFLCKPVDMDELSVILRRAFYIAQLESEYKALRQQIPADAFEGMLGTSRPMQQVFAAVRKVATTDAPVLILGESGTGKEMAAVAIHRRSQRKSGPFVAINCAAIPESLLESELFGHEKGAFTGAHVQRKGRFEAAASGTLFLDEIGELPLSLQVKLLRFLQEQTIERVGGRETISVDTRLIAATNSDLQKLMAESKFREDLYYRLAVVVIKIPALREREGDVSLLANFFLAKHGAQNRKKFIPLAGEAQQAIEAYPWPGNVRELENRIQRAAIMAEGSQVTSSDLELAASSEVAASPQTLKEARDKLDKQLVQKALARHKGKISQAAAELGISRPGLYELMDKLGVIKEPKSG